MVKKYKPSEIYWPNCNRYYAYKIQNNLFAIVFMYNINIVLKLYYFIFLNKT